MSKCSCKELKQFSTIFFALIVFLQTFSRFVVEADYFLNKSYITRVFCINKEKPKMHCDGKCYLAKQLKEEQKQEQQAPVTKKNNIDIQLFNLSEPVQLNLFEYINKVEYPSGYLLHLASFPHSVFHPPTV